MRMEILAGRLILQVWPEKQARVAAAIEAMLEKGVASASEVEHLLGIWIWMMLPCRMAVSILAVIYAFMRDFAEQPAQKLWRAVQAELWCLVFLLPLFAVDLSASWHPWAYQVDASLEGYGAVASRSSAPELRSEAQFCERKGWVVQADQAYSDFEESFWCPDEDGARPPEPPRVRNKQLFRGFLELFSRSGRLSSAV